PHYKSKVGLTTPPELETIKNAKVMPQLSLKMSNHNQLIPTVLGYLVFSRSMDLFICLVLFEPPLASK
ncbi:MAG: hypothetical protein ONB05_05440, partial [candidate division KSB1 bacterium]|nr:hypothetical protein [candidate division KSB1 bacterium]